MHVLALYMGVLVGIFFEGELILISSIVAAHYGYLNIWIVLIISVIATYSADVFYFFLGRRKGKRLLEKRNKLKHKAEIVDNHLKKFPALLFIGYRFMYGMRTITPLVIGIGSINARKFLIYSAFGTLLWVVFFGFIGYVFGGYVKSELGNIEHIEKYVVGILLLAAMIILFIRKVKFKKDPAKSSDLNHVN